jgi:hypothetical protein
MMWQPNRAQWRMLWPLAALLVLAWPPGQGRSLLVKIVNRAADPAGALPDLPPPLPIGLDDNGDAVTAHDEQEREYYQVRGRSSLTRWRMDLKTARDPFDPTTERQLWVGIAVFGALVLWRLDGHNKTTKNTMSREKNDAL